MIYISLTTVPERLAFWGSLSRNLNSLLNQKTDKEYYVILNIPEVYAIDENIKYVIPPELDELVKTNPKLIINRKTPDYGPIVKVAGALEFAKNPDDIIIACDDDQVYHEEMLEYHVKKINEHPDSVICFRGDGAVEKRDFVDKDGIKKYVLMSCVVYFPVHRDCHLVIPGHWHSVGYRRSFLEEDFNEDLFKLADGDDIIMGYYLRLHGILCRCVKWDGETNFAPLNSFIDRPCWSFPIVEQLAYPLSGGTRIRQRYADDPTVLKGNHGKEEQIVTELLTEYNKIYTARFQNL